MQGVDIAKLAAELAAGAITTEVIRAKFGSGVLSAVLGVSGGIAAGIVTNYALDFLNQQTGIVDDVGSIIDDAFSIFD